MIPNRDNLGSRAPRGSPRSQAQVLIVIVLVGDPSLHHGVINTIGRPGFRIVVATRSHLWTLYEYGIQANQSIFDSDGDFSDSTTQLRLSASPAFFRRSRND